MTQAKFSLAAIALSVVLFSCADDSTKNTGDANNGATPDSLNRDANNNTGNNANTNNVSNTPLTKDDSTFVMEAAVGGMTEVESGRAAQQNAVNARVKNFGAMMVADHEKANQELMSFASSRGITLPSTVPADKLKHVQEMQKMKGKSFDSHYMSMMTTDHQKTISLFEKQAASGGDAQLKTWAANTLPVLKKHLDSAQAIKKGM